MAQSNDLDLLRGAGPKCRSEQSEKGDEHRTHLGNNDDLTKRLTSLFSSWTTFPVTTGLEMPPHPLFQSRAIALHPSPHRRVIGLQAALLHELFDIAQRQRVSKVPTNGTKNECGLCLPPF